MSSAHAPREERLEALLRQREGELALVKSVQSALAAKLDIQAIHDLVGEKIRSVVDADSVGLASYDPATNVVQLRYLVEKGERLPLPPGGPLRPGGLGETCMRTRRPVVANRDALARAAEAGSRVIGVAPKSFAF